MYAVVDIKGFQYKLEKGDRLKVPKYDLEVGKKISIPDVLLVSDNANVTVGTPYVKGATVEATVVDQGKYDKITVFKKKRRKDYSVKRGHRQDFTELEINSISLSGKTEPSPEPEKAPESVTTDTEETVEVESAGAEDEKASE